MVIVDGRRGLNAGAQNSDSAGYLVFTMVVTSQKQTPHCQAELRSSRVVLSIIFGSFDGVSALSLVVYEMYVIINHGTAVGPD